MISATESIRKQEQGRTQEKRLDSVEEKPTAQTEEKDKVGRFIKGTEFAARVLNAEKEKEERLRSLFNDADGYDLLVLTAEEMKSEHPRPWLSRGEAVSEFFRMLEGNLSRKRKITQIDTHKEEKDIEREIENFLETSDSVMHLSETGVSRRLEVTRAEIGDFFRRTEEERLKMQIAKSISGEDMPEPVRARKIKAALQNEGYFSKGDESDMYVYKRNSSPQQPTRWQRLFKSFASKNDPRRTIKVGRIWRTEFFSVYGEENVQELRDFAARLYRATDIKLKISLEGTQAESGPFPDSFK